jgi:hypothetical protein
MHKIKVLAKGPLKVPNRGNGSMGTTIGKGGKKKKPMGSDASKVKGNTKGKFNTKKYGQVRKAVFGLGK